MKTGVSSKNALSIKKGLLAPSSRLSSGFSVESYSENATAHQIYLSSGSHPKADNHLEVAICY